MAFYRKAGGIGAAAILTPDDQNNPDKSHIDRHAPNCSRSLLHSMTQRCLPACLPLKTWLTIDLRIPLSTFLLYIFLLEILTNECITCLSREYIYIYNIKNSKFINSLDWSIPLTSLKKNFSSELHSPESIFHSASLEAIIRLSIINPGPH